MNVAELKEYVESNDIIQRAEEFLKNKELPIAEFAFNITQNVFTLNRELPYNCQDEFIVLREHKRKIEWYALPIDYHYTLLGNHRKMIEV